MRIRLIVLLVALVAAGLPAVAVTVASPPATAGTTSPYALVSVSENPLGNVTAASPYALTPAFSPSTTDYLLRCNAGTNEVTLTLTGTGGPVSVGTNQQSSPDTGGSVNVTLSVVPNGAIVLYSPNPSRPGTPDQYWIRCLPPDFPAIQVDTAGPSSPGWNSGYYFTGTIPATGQTTSYAMVLDGNGVPVWYQELAATAGGALNVEPLPDGTIAWSPSLGPGFGAGLNGNAYTEFDLASQSTVTLPAAVSPTDEHELWPLHNGDRLMISTPVISGDDLSALGDGSVFLSSTTVPSSAADGNVVDCVVQEVNASSQAVWSWDASQHIGLDEITTVNGPGPNWTLNSLNGNPAADIYHCNSVSIDEDTSSPYFGDILVSMRYLNAVYLIDPTTGDVIWKLGGTPLTSNDPETGQSTPAHHLAITDDGEGGICGQHDARFVATPNPAVEDISVFDDHTGCTGAARGVEFAIDAAAGTASPDYQYAQPQGFAVSATGSFRRMPDADSDIGSGTSLIGWGITGGSFPSGFTEVDGSGNALYDVRFPDGETIYRAIKVAASDVDLALLRQTAGWTGSTIPPPPSGPQVTGVSPSSGSTIGGTAVTISGSDLAGASSVTFGGHEAAFAVTAAGTVVATAPPAVGPGTVDIAVTAPGGTSATGSADHFTYTGTSGSAPRIVGMAPTPDGGGYWLAASDGRVDGFGDAGFYGSAGGLPLNTPIVAMAATPSGKGYWLVASDGGIFDYGDAGFYGSRGGQPLNDPIVGMAVTPSGKGYWLVASDGGIFDYGDAGFYGSRGGQALNRPVVGMAASLDGGGYWLVASDGGIFDYGDAGFFGSAGSLTLNKPVVGMAASHDGGGYRLVASDGGIFDYGDAGFFGSAGSFALNKPVVGMAAPDDGGYWLVASDGGVFTYGDADFKGSVLG